MNIMVAIFVVLFIVLAMTIDAIVRRRAPAPALSAVRREIPLPGGLFLDTGHTWTALEPSGRIRVGADDLVRAAIGHADKVELPEPGMEVRQGQPLFTLVTGERRAVIASPVDGVVRSVNPALAENGASLARDPYRRGWICALSPKNLGASLRKLKVAEEAVEWLGKERERFEEFAASRIWRNAVPGTAMADGGKPADGILNYMDDEAWAAFGREFLEPRDAAPAE
jgi:glycine cleavage system H lipoate-binding protein